MYIKNETKTRESTPYFKISIERPYKGDAKNILKGLLLFVNFSSAIIWPDLKEIRIVIKVRINPDTVNPIAPISEAKSLLFSLEGRLKMSK